MPTEIRHNNVLTFVLHRVHFHTGQYSHFQKCTLFIFCKRHEYGHRFLFCHGNQFFYCDKEASYHVIAQQDGLLLCQLAKSIVL